MSPKGRLAISPLPSARFAADLHNKKVDDVLRLFTSDALVVNPDGSMAHAGLEMREFFDKTTGAMDSDMQIRPKHVKQIGQDVIETGRYTENVRERGTGKVQVIKGKYLFIGRCEADGVYRYSRMEWY